MPATIERHEVMNEHCGDNPLRSALFTDLYELTMARAYDSEGMDGDAVFELFFRSMPSSRNYIVAAGLDDVLTYLEQWQFNDSDLEFLSRREEFPDDFLHRLKRLKFTGDVYAVPEGTPVFPNEPLVQVVAPIIAAQIVETLILNQVHFQSIAATKAARIVAAAKGRNVVDFGSRRAHSTAAAMQVARVSYMAGAAGSSNVLAGKVYDIPIFGTMAHSYIQAHGRERPALEAFTKLYPQTTLLVDTFDTLEGVRKVIELSRQLEPEQQPRAIRLDSGDLAQLAKDSRRMLDEAGLKHIRIFASSGLNEFKIAELLEAGAPIDGFGVGTKLAVSPDAAELDMAYKLVEYAGQPRTKLSSDKIIYPGRKQVFRQAHESQSVGFTRDLIARQDEQHDGEPLLQHVMHEGRRLPAGRKTLAESREYTLAQLQRLPDELLDLEKAAEEYPVEISDALQADLEALRRQHAVP